jgi:MoxR-like ATPase
MPIGPAATAKIEEVRAALSQYGSSSIIVLSGVAGTGKTFIGLAAAQQHTGHPLFVKQIQFHQAYSYEDFIEGLRPNVSGGFEPRSGVLLDWNEAALQDRHNQYVLLIEEFTRANVTAVIGELMTYIEHRSRYFETPITRRNIRIAENLSILATLNPKDRTALEIDDALLRRLQVVECPPSNEQLVEILQSSLPNHGNTEGEHQIIDGLVHLFDECRTRHQETFDEMMPFGHGMFAGITSVADLQMLWRHRIKHILSRPQVPKHPYYDDIVELYPWR